MTMKASTTIYITLFLNAFYIHAGMGSPVAGTDSGVNVNVNVIVNENNGRGGSGQGSESGSDTGNCNKDCGHWCYPSKNWPYTCPEFCSEHEQSPINICSDSTKPETGSITFSSSYSDVIAKVPIKNNGHAVGVTLDGSLPARTISGGELTGPYTLAQFHFHWGCENSRGSEHVVDGTRYALELHLVHYKTIYGNLSEALKYKDGLAVIGIFFNVGAENAALKPITDNLHEVIKAGPEKEIDFNIALINLIPTTRTFYRYQGSLTTPTCNEVVTWSVFSTELSFSQKQASAFRMLKDKQHHQMCDNYRGTQPLNGREVKKYQ